MDKKIAIVCNPTAAGQKSVEVGRYVAAELEARGVAYVLHTAFWPDAFIGCTQVWICGGDGTLNYFINKYPHISLPLFLFKGGTGNDFAWLLYGNDSLVDQLERALRRQETVLVDAGLCNGRLFLNGVGIGFDGLVVHELLGKPKRPGKASYLLTVLKHLVQYKEGGAQIVMDDRQWNEPLFMLSVANGKRYGGGFIVAPDACLQDGKLDVVLITAIKHLQRLQYLNLIEAGKHLGLAQVRVHQSKAVQVQTVTATTAHIDGEPLRASEYHISCLPKKFVFVR